MYRGAATVIGVGGKFTRRISIKAVVKQGCLLSLLFNIMDELIERAEQRKVGIKVKNEVVGVMVFADDLILPAEDPGNMTILLKCCETFFDNKSLSVNSTKYACLNVLPVKGNKAMKVITGTHQYWKREPIPSFY